MAEKDPDQRLPSLKLRGSEPIHIRDDSAPRPASNAGKSCYQYCLKGRKDTRQGEEMAERRIGPRHAGILKGAAARF